MSSSIARNIEDIKLLLPAGIELVAVSKFKPVSAILDAYNAGQRAFGESRVQELIQKEAALPKDIRWHFIGHLQTNKVKSIIGKTALIQSVDSERLLTLIDAEGIKQNVKTEVLLQVHIAQEETKFGFLPQELKYFVESDVIKNLVATEVRGLMAMASNTSDTKRIREDFETVASLFRDLTPFMSGFGRFDLLSMGMSHDWPLAVEAGANIIRVGSAIFGER